MSLRGSGHGLRKKADFVQHPGSATPPVLCNAGKHALTWTRCEADPTGQGRENVASSAPCPGTLSAFNDSS